MEKEVRDLWYTLLPQCCGSSESQPHLVDDITEALHIFSAYPLEFLSAFKLLLFLKLCCLEAALRKEMGLLQARKFESTLLSFFYVRIHSIMSVIEPKIPRTYVPWRFVSKFSVLCIVNCAWTLTFSLMFFFIACNATSQWLCIHCVLNFNDGTKEKFHHKGLVP